MADSAVSRRLSEITGVALFAATLLWLIALVSYSSSDPAWFFNSLSAASPQNFAGRVGAFIAEAAFQLVGYSAYLIPVMLGYLAWHYFWCTKIDAGYTKLIGIAMLFGSVAGLLDLASRPFDTSALHFQTGGVVGNAIANLCAALLNRTGAAILLCTVLAFSVLLSTQMSLGAAFTRVALRVRNRPSLLDRYRGWRDERARAKERQMVVEKHLKKAGKDKAPEIASKAAEAAEKLRSARLRPSPDEDDDEDEAPAVKPGPKAAAPAIRRQAPVPQPLPLENDDTAKAPAERKKGGYVLPPVTLLDASKDQRKIDERDLMDAARLLEEKCREFSVEGTVVQIHPGPVVTTYEFKPDAGVKYSRITGLADDLCLAMKAESILIDRIPGKSTVGIQIPNPHREAITLRELLETDVFARASSKLTMALGKTIHGEPFISDMSTMPHLLIAGSTGAGKSVSVNAMISSILFRCTADDVRFIMIDPKRLELGMYEDIPHLLTPVVVDPKQAANALRWGVREMEERYKTLAAHGVRNIDQYNRNIKAAIAEGGGKGEDGVELKTMPYIVVIIDELADLMMAAGREVEESIARIAQMARAVGIHLILATQRPSVDVITGLIKANLPARIAFRVASKIDSRTILDGNGAEQLLGKGDMLYLPPASSRFVRIHGPYISEQETARLCSFLRKQGKPVYDRTITAEEKAGPEKLEFEKDELFDEAARIVVSSGQASISYLQRRLRIGFSRAARLIDMMEMDGVVSPAAGGKREVLVDQNYFAEVDAQLK
ncbi:MAG TPA: DNA translocase FtsK [Vicinamibacterales bacterium]|nr:DNA translocase FtsK [Vicinamibacterales bacterium]